MSNSTPQTVTRTDITNAIKSYCNRNGMNHAGVWRMIYQEFRRQYRIDLQARAKKTGCKALDMCQKLGMLEQLHGLVKHKLG